MANNYTVPYMVQMECSQPNTTIPAPPFLASNSSLPVSSCSISSYVPSVEILLSSCCSTNIPSSGYELDACAWRYCNVTGQSGVNNFEGCMNRSAPSGVVGKCFDGTAVNAKPATSGSGIPWKGKKKKTVSAGLLIALGIAGMVMGG